MYKIIGADEKEHGPVSADQIRQWLAEGRVNAQTQVQAGEGTAWKPLADFPEFATAPKAAVTPPPLSAPAAPQKTSGLAIASLVCGICGLLTCGISALVGLVLGLVALNKTKKGTGQSGGSGIALAGTIVSAVFAVLIPVFVILAAMLLPALSKAKERAQTINCVNNLKQLALGIRIYSGDNKDQFPPAATWCDAIKTNVGSDRVFKCISGDLNQRCHYAFNAKLAGQDVNKVASDTVLLFETTGGWNVSGGPELMLGQPRHGRLFVVALADGSVQQLTAARLKSLRWDP